MAKIKILVACHKQAEVYSDDVYIPIQVGKALHPELDLGYIGDNEGNNISAKNQFYCELTAQYWGWKNLDCEYIGLSHYRRYFNYKFSPDNVDSIFEDCDVVLSKPFHWFTSVDQKLREELSLEDVIIFELVIKNFFPEYYDAAKSYLLGNLVYSCNMFVCPQKIFNEFAEWQFSVLSKVEEIVIQPRYTREKRLFGYLAETLFPIYCIKNKLRLKTMPIVGSLLTKELDSSLSESFFQILKRNFVFNLRKPNDFYIPDALLIGLKQDGIADLLGL